VEVVYDKPPRSVPDLSENRLNCQFSLTSNTGFGVVPFLGGFPDAVYGRAFGKRIREAGILGSMGTVGDCYDNAMMESFWHTMQLNASGFKAERLRAGSVRSSAG
jgi:hypothetical protein